MEKIENTKSFEYIKEDKKFVRKILKLLDGQSRVKRWRKEGEKPFLSPEEVESRGETVTEHIGSMTQLISLIYTKAESEKDMSITSLNMAKVITKVSLHDSEEMITGDERVKTEEHRVKEEEAQKEINNEISTLNFGEAVNHSMEDYENKKTPEDRFVKAIDELQAWMYMINTRSISESKHNIDYLKRDEMKGYIFAKEFPTLLRILDIILHFMSRGHFVDENIMEME